MRTLITLLTLPLITGAALGMFIMAPHVSRTVLSIQAAATLIALLALLLTARFARAIPHAHWLAPLLLAAPLAFGGDGPYRWLPFGVHIGWLVLPSFAYLHARSEYPRWTPAITCAAVLALQPDPTMALALLAACAVSARWSPDRRGASALGLALITLACAIAIARNIPLPPVPHVEQIVTLADAHHPLVAAAALLALIALSALPTLLHTRSAWALSATLAVLAAAPLFGAWPVPVVGFGASPLIGIGAAYGLVLREARPQAMSLV